MAFGLEPTDCTAEYVVAIVDADRFEALCHRAAGRRLALHRPWGQDPGWACDIVPPGW